MKGKRHMVTPEEREHIRRKYHSTKSQVLADELGMSVSAVYRIAFSCGLKKDPELIKQWSREKMMNPDHPGRKHWIRKGNVPSNKGKRQMEYMTPEAIERSKNTRFKPGHTPSNHKPVGYERISKYGYVEVKTKEPNTFKFKHRLIWENQYGKIPKGHNVQFKDGNNLNLSIDNLYLISRADQLRHENSIHVRYPEDVKKAICATAALGRHISKLTKKQQ